MSATQLEDMILCY